MTSAFYFRPSRFEPDPDRDERVRVGLEACREVLHAAADRRDEIEAGASEADRTLHAARARARRDRDERNRRHRAAAAAETAEYRSRRPSRSGEDELRSVLARYQQSASGGS